MEYILHPIVVLGALSGLGRMEHRAQANAHKSPLNLDGSDQPTPGFDRYGAAWQSKYHRDFYGNPAAIPQQSRAKVDPSRRYLNVDATATNLRRQALLRRAGMSSRTENPWRHRDQPNGGMGLVHSPKTDRYGYKSLGLLQRTYSSPGNDNAPAMHGTGAVTAYNRLNERWWEVRAR